MKEYEIKKKKIKGPHAIAVPRAGFVAPFLGNSRVWLLFLVQRRHGSEQKGPHAANLTLLLYKDFKVLVDDCDREEDPSSRSDGTQEVSQDREGPNTQPSEGSSSGDVAGEEEMRQQGATT